MFNVAKGAALMAGVEYDIKLNNGLYEILTNETGAKVLQKNMNLPIVYTRGNSFWQQTHARKRYGRKRY
jgi:aminobenzoyl-glutamate utilization protein B